MKKILLLMVTGLLLGGCASTGSYQGSSGPSINAAQYFPIQRMPTGKKTFVFSPRASAWAAYDEDGFRVKTGRASGGVDACPEDGSNCRTITGVFQVQRKGGSDCISKKYPLGKGGAPMNYCMYFHGGYAIHGSPVVPNVPSSHGCIRVQVADARWLNQDFLNIGSTVIVESY